MPVLNLASFMGLGNPAEQKVMMVAEYSRHVLGFLVRDVDRIVRVDWNKVHAADSVSNSIGNLITAITELPNGTLVSILDVEQILSTAFGDDVVGKIEKVEKGNEKCVFFVDDSAVARKKITEVLDKMGVKNIQAHNGLEAWQRLKGLADSAQHTQVNLHQQIQVILVDAEMPEMDGYVLTQHISASVIISAFIHSSGDAARCRYNLFFNIGEDLLMREMLEFLPGRTSRWNFQQPLRRRKPWSNAAAN